MSILFDLYLDASFIYLLCYSVPNIVYWIIYRNKSSSHPTKITVYIVRNICYLVLTVIFIWKLGWRHNIASLILFWFWWILVIFATITSIADRDREGQKVNLLYGVVRIVVCFGIWYFLVR